MPIGLVWKTETFKRWYIIGGRTTNEKREKWRQNWPLKRNEYSINKTAIPYGSNRCSNYINHSNVSQVMTNCNDIKGMPEVKSSFAFLQVPNRIHKYDFSPRQLTQTREQECSNQIIKPTTCMQRDQYPVSDANCNTLISL